jgi:hypothetical protein
VTCAPNPPPPEGFVLWQGDVAPPLSQWAVDLRDHMGPYPYGTVWVLPYGGQYVVARKDHHTWTYRRGRLLTGLCIPGITLYRQVVGTASSTATSSPSAAAGTSGLGLATSAGSLTAAPDPTAAVYGAEPHEHPDWRMVGLTAGAILAVGGLFVAALHFAGEAAAAPARASSRTTRRRRRG